MPPERIIPTVETAAEFIIKVNGTEIPRTVSRLSVNVTKVVNKISIATLVILDGDPSTGKFPLTDGALFTPGNKIEITAGEPKKSVSIFNGIIVKQSLKVRNHIAPQLIVECKHRVVKTTVGKKSSCFHSSTDSEAFEKILKDNGFSSSDFQIESSDLIHDELVQYNCTDWDFILSRSEMIGKIILTNDDGIEIKSPEVNADAALSVMLGSSMIELDAEIDSRNQYATVKVKSWDMANQEVVDTDGKKPAAIIEHGTLSADDLAAVAAPADFILNHGGTLTEQERQLWADAQLLKSRLSKIRGRVKFAGITGINPGDVLELGNLGNRFNGKAFVSGVRHDYTLNEGWKTQAQFGHNLEWFADEQKLNAPKAGGLLPGSTGLHTGVVTDNEDPLKEMRVRVKIPFINPDDDGIWARIALTDAGNDRGMFFRPEIGDEVLLGFLYDDPRQPVILGMLHSSALPSPLQPTNDNHLKGYTSREKHKLIFDDDKKEIRIETPGGNKGTFTDDKQGFIFEDQSGNKVETTPSQININDANGNSMVIDINANTIKINANAKVVVEAPQIELVDSASHALVFGDELLTYLNQMVQTYQTHTHPGQMAGGFLPVTPMTPVPPMQPAKPSLLSTKVKTG
jgi:Rhs element Vgr protein